MKKLGDVEAVHGMTRERFFADYYQKRPVILRGAIGHWPAVREWSPEYFGRRYGETRAWIDYYDQHQNRTFLDQRLDYSAKEVVLREYLDSLADGDQPYAIRESQGLFRKHPELLEDMDRFQPFGGEGEDEKPFVALWIGPAGSLTGMHIDIGESQLFHLYGRKRFILFAPDQTPVLYEEHPQEKLRRMAPEQAARIPPEVLKIFQEEMRWSAVNPLRPDTARYPLVEQARYWDGWIEPGDVVYVPSGWWHAVHSLTVSISVTKSLHESGFLYNASA